MKLCDINISELKKTAVVELIRDTQNEMERMALSVQENKLEIEKIKIKLNYYSDADKIAQYKKVFTDIDENIKKLEADYYSSENFLMYINSYN